MDFELKIRIGIAMRRHCQQAGLPVTMDWFTHDIDEELRSSTPPPSGKIVTLYLMLDTDFMTAFLRQNRGRRGRSGLPFIGLRSIAGISHDPYHPLYSQVKRAFDYSQARRKLAGFPPDPWPMQFEVAELKDRRLVWNLVGAEIKDAWKMYHRFVREGFRPFSVDSQGDPQELVSCFDPQSGELLFRGD